MTMKNVATSPDHKKKPKKLTGARLKELSVLAAPQEYASPKRTLCHECARHTSCTDPFIHQSYDDGFPEILFLFGQRINEDEFQYLERLLHETRTPREAWTAIDAVRCPSRKAPTVKQIRACRPFLVGLVKRHRPRYILAFGSVALRAATNDGKLKKITPLRGKEYVFDGLETQDTTVYATYPLSDLLGNHALAGRVKEDILRCRAGGLPVLQPPSQALPTGTPLGIDSEFMSDGRVVTLSAADRLSAIAADVVDGVGTARILQRLQRTSVIAGHNLSVDIDSLVRLSRERRTPIRALERWIQGRDIVDSLVLSRMVDENRGKGGYALENLLRSNHHAPQWKDTEEEIDLSNPLSWPTDYRVERCRLDAWAPVVLCSELREQARGPIELTHRVTQSLRRVYHAGARVDEDYFRTLTRGFSRDAAKAKRTLGILAGRMGFTEFSPTNDNHLRDILFTRYKLKAEEFTKESKLPSVNKTFLKKYKDHEFVKALLEFNIHDKRASTYGGGLAGKFSIGSDGLPMLRFRINPLGARTGRRSSEKPNAQNWPKDVRRIIVSRFHDGAIVDNDYSKLEVILFAYVAKEQKLLEFFQGPNGYIAVGRELFNKVVKEDTDEYRTIKSIVLGIQYGMGAFKLAYQLWNVVGVKLSSDWDTHVEKASELRERYLRKFPGIKRYMWNQKSTLLREQSVRSLSGRVRHLPCPFGEETAGFGHLLNQAINFPIQSLASDVTGAAMVDLERALLSKYKLSYEEYHWRLMTGKYPEMPLLINEVHDDLVLDMPRKGRKENLELITHIMREVPTLREICPTFKVALNVGQKVGSRWGLDDMKEAA